MVTTDFLAHMGVSETTQLPEYATMHASILESLAAIKRRMDGGEPATPAEAPQNEN